MPKISAIGVLTSGGDAPGMNAAIRAVVRTAKYYDMKVMGIRKGYEGLIHGDIYEMSARDVSDIMHRGGTILQTARSAEFKTPEGVKRAVSTARYFDIEGIIVIGGDGSFRGARELCAEGMPSVGVPGTIDNDISCTEYTIGFDTAINTAKDAVDKIRDTATSHERCNIIKVMGRASGSIALNVGIATGAEAILIPERGVDFTRDILEPINRGKKRNKKHFIIIVAEGVADSGDLEARIEAETGIETRTTILGYVQRGGSPTVVDRVYASRMGSYAVELLKEGMGNRIIGVAKNQIYDIDIFEGLDVPYTIREDLIDLSKILSI
ncbi:MAG: 6-phosphofructokinase [Clostridiales bacterium]|jgi:6-phosphofructokinase 1|nr:6-phosphofructokinase [Clostridiales bacterium]